MRDYFCYMANPFFVRFGIDANHFMPVLLVYQLTDGYGARLPLHARNFFLVLAVNV